MAWATELEQDSHAYAIAAATDPVLRVIAGPGTGKSFIITRRVARLLETDVVPEQVLVIAPSRAGVCSLLRELDKLNIIGREKLAALTLDGLAGLILSREHVRAAIGRTPRPLNAFELESIFLDVGRRGGKRAVRRSLAWYKACLTRKANYGPPRDKIGGEKAIVAAILTWLRFHDGMLYSELSSHLVCYLNGSLDAPERSEYAHVIVDDFQEFNELERTALACLGEKADTCIFSDGEHFDDPIARTPREGFYSKVEERPARSNWEITECLRCPTAVVEMANSLISFNVIQASKALTPVLANGRGEVMIVQLPTPSDEAEWIARQVSSLLATGVNENEIIILVQNPFFTRLIREALKRARVRALLCDGEGLLETSAARERISRFRLFIDRDDRVALRYLLGVGHRDYRRASYLQLRQHCEVTGDRPWSVLQKVASGTAKIKNIVSLLAPYHDLTAELAALERCRFDLPRLVDRLFPAADDDIADLREMALQRLPEGLTPSELLVAMLEGVTQPTATCPTVRVRVMSVRNSNGICSPYVFIAGCVEENFSSSPKIENARVVELSIEEARRWFYTGMTRVHANPAQRRPGRLSMSYPLQMLASDARDKDLLFRSQSGSMANLVATRFLNELGPEAPRVVRPQLRAAID